MVLRLTFCLPVPSQSRLRVVIHTLVLEGTDWRAPPLTPLNVGRGVQWGRPGHTDHRRRGRCSGGSSQVRGALQGGSEHPAFLLRPAFCSTHTCSGAPCMGFKPFPALHSPRVVVPSFLASWSDPNPAQPEDQEPQQGAGHGSQSPPGDEHSRPELPLRLLTLFLTLSSRPAGEEMSPHPRPRQSSSGGALVISRRMLTE